MPRPFRLSVLDQSPISEGSDGGTALRNSIDLATLCDALGYERYWVAEHHGTPGLACASPEVLIGPIAAATQRIRVGSGGVMLPHYSPLKVAANFSMLAAMYPDRIDLGLGRAAGTDPSTTFALQRDRRQPSPDDFPDQLDELLGYLEGRRSRRQPMRRAAVLPGGAASPAIWLLGSSPQSGVWAAELGLPYCFADFINLAGAEIARHYRDAYAPSAVHAMPRTGVAIWAICAPTDDEAQSLSSSFRMLISMLHRGRLIAVPTVDAAERYLQEVGEDRLGPPRRIIAGSPDTVRTEIERVADEYEADEVFLVNILHDHAARRRSYELIAESFALQPALR